MLIVLVEPEIPGNTGNISRLCAALQWELHLVKPLGFSVDDKHLKRAGLDYWSLLKVHYHESFQEVLELYHRQNFYFNTTKAKKLYTEVQYTVDDLLVFGKETASLPELLLNSNDENCIRIPLVKDARSLNLSNAAAIVAYEAMRQIGYPGLC